MIKDFSKLIFVLFCIPVLGQEKLNELKIPSSPASNIIGVNPSAVLNPKSYQALETALYSGIQDGSNSSLIPTDIALEFTPYWFTNHSLSFEEYLFPQSTIEQILRNSSISFANTQNYILGNDFQSSSVGIGYRTSLFFPYKKDKQMFEDFKSDFKDGADLSGNIYTALIPTLTQMLSNNKSKDEIIPELAKVVDDAIENRGLLDEEKRKVLKTSFEDEANKIEFQFTSSNQGEIQSELLEILEELSGKTQVMEIFKDYLQRRYGWGVDIAYATFLNFPDNEFEFSYVPKQAFWVSPHLFLGKNLDLSAIFRYQWYNLSFYDRYFPENESFENNFDYGLAASIEVDKFSFGLELVGRYSNSLIPAGENEQGQNLYIQDNDKDFQYIGSLSYKLTDQIMLSYQLGSQFAEVQNSNQTLVSLVGLNFGFGAPDQDNIEDSFED